MQSQSEIFEFGVRKRSPSPGTAGGVQTPELFTRGFATTNGHRNISVTAAMQRLASSSLRLVQSTAPAVLRTSLRTFATVSVTKLDGTQNKVDVAASANTLLEALKAKGVDISGKCGGETSCGGCHIVVDQEHFGKLPEKDEDEAELLGSLSNITGRSRLACAVKPVTADVDGMSVQHVGTRKTL